MHPPILNINTLYSVLNCSGTAGMIFYLIILCFAFPFVYLPPFFFLSSPLSFNFLIQTFLLSVFLSPFLKSTFLTENVYFDLCLPPLLTNSYSVLHVLVFPALDSNTDGELEHLIVLPQSFRWIVSFGVTGVWKRGNFLGSSRCFASIRDRKMD